MPTETANLNPPVLPVGQGLTFKELQVFRPVSTKAQVVSLVTVVTRLSYLVLSSEQY